LLPQCSAMQQSYQQVLHMLPAFAAVMAMQERCAAAANPCRYGRARPSEWSGAFSCRR
jgi:hypothetical protein